MPDSVEAITTLREYLAYIYWGAPCSGCRSTEHNGCTASKDPWR